MRSGGRQSLCFYGRQNKGPQNAHPRPWNLWICDLTWHKDFTCNGRGSWITQVGPVESQGSLQEGGGRVRGREKQREKDPTAFQTVSSCHVPSKSRSFQTSYWFCRRRKKCSQQKAPPCLLSGKLILLLEGGESQS